MLNVEFAFIIQHLALIIPLTPSPPAEALAKAGKPQTCYHI